MEVPIDQGRHNHRNMNHYTVKVLMIRFNAGKISLPKKGALRQLAAKPASLTPRAPSAQHPYQLNNLFLSFMIALVASLEDTCRISQKLVLPPCYQVSLIRCCQAISVCLLSPLMISSTTWALNSGVYFLRFAIVNSPFEPDIRLSYVSNLRSSLQSSDYLARKSSLTRARI